MNSVVKKEAELRLENLYHIRTKLEEATEEQRLNVLGKYCRHNSQFYQ